MFSGWIRVGFVQPCQEISHCEAGNCGRRCHHHEKVVVEIPTLRYALFGRPDCGYNNRWSYYAWDAINAVPIPVGVERNQWQLNDGDKVHLLGTPGLWVVVRTEYFH